MSLQIQKYTEKSIVIRGDTKTRINDIKTISGAKFGYYGGEPGWMFPATMEGRVRNVLGLTGPYVDGPKPNPKSAQGTQYTQNTSSSTQYTQNTQNTPALSNVLSNIPQADSKAPPPRGGLRSKAPPQDPELEDIRTNERLQTLEEFVSVLSGLPNEVATLSSLVKELTTVVTTLTEKNKDLTEQLNQLRKDFADATTEVPV